MHPGGFLPGMKGLPDMLPLPREYIPPKILPPGVDMDTKEKSLPKRN
jgi:hypothetical protein